MPCSLFIHGCKVKVCFQLGRHVGKAILFFWPKDKLTPTFFQESPSGLEGLALAIDVTRVHAFAEGIRAKVE